MITTKEHLTNLFRAKFPFIYIPTWEELRITELIMEIAQSEEIKRQREIYVWSLTEGLKTIVDKREEVIEGITDVIQALTYADNYNNDALFILKDIHSLLDLRPQSLNLIRKIRDVAASLKNQKASKNVVIIAPSLVLPDDLQKEITVVDFELPSIDDLTVLLNKTIDEYQDVIEIDLDENGKEVLCKAAQGLTALEAENAFSRAMVEKNRLSVKDLNIILDEKCQVIKKTGVLEFIKSDFDINDIGGLENMKKWLVKRNNSWLKKAQSDYNLPAPKGILITGVPGCGKSLTAKAMSAMWNLPLLRLDVGRIFSGLVGSSEENMRKAIKTAEAVSPSILWVDEIEKGFGSPDGARDGGTSARVFATFLTWLQEKTKPVFVIATANNIDKIPPEMLRKGRFDEIFFTDLPTTNERKTIFNIHLKKRIKGSVSEKFKITDELLNKLAKETEGFVGSEIEQIVISALFDAFSEDRTLEETDLFKAISNTVPLSLTQAEQIEKIRAWASTRAVAATAQSDRYSYNEFINSTKDTDKELNKVIKFRGGRTIDF